MRWIPRFVDHWIYVWQRTDRTDHWVYRFLIEHGDRRITAKALRFYRFGRPGRDFQVFVHRERSGVLAVSCGAMRDGRLVYSITVTHRKYRGYGIGSELLRKKLEFFARKGVRIETQVAADNTQSLRMCEKAGLVVRDEVPKVRKDGQNFLAKVLVRR
jgi:GNAT superfamily N-acetyltransferase